MCHYSIGPLYNFSSKFLQGYCSLLPCIRDILLFKHCSCVRGWKWLATTELFRNPNSSSQFNFQNQTQQKIKKWRTHEQYSSIRIFSSNFLSFFSYQIRTTNSLFFISDSNNNTQTVPNPNHTHTLFHSDSHLNSTITTNTVCLIPQVSLSNQNKEEEEAVWSFPDHFFSPFSRPKQEGSFFSFSFIFFVQNSVYWNLDLGFMCVFLRKLSMDPWREEQEEDFGVKIFLKKRVKKFRRGGATVVALRPPRRKSDSSPEKMKIHLLRPSLLHHFPVFF